MWLLVLKGYTNSFPLVSRLNKAPCNLGLNSSWLFTCSFYSREKDTGLHAVEKRKGPVTNAFEKASRCLTSCFTFFRIFSQSVLCFVFGLTERFCIFYGFLYSWCSSPSRFFFFWEFGVFFFFTSITVIRLSPGVWSIIGGVSIILGSRLPFLPLYRARGDRSWWLSFDFTRRRKEEDSNVACKVFSNVPTIAGSLEAFIALQDAW